jgi:hypothetical protein
MTVAQRKSLVEESKVVSTTVLYDIAIEGVAPLLLNKIPDLTEAKAKGRDQSRKDKHEIEKETWREKLHTDDNNQVIIPRINLWRAIIAGSKKWGEKIKGGGKKQYSSIIPDSLIVMTDMGLGIQADDEKQIVPFSAPCNGTPTMGKRAMVTKIRPCILKWKGDFRVCVSDALITPDVLATSLAYAGKSGLGDWRPLYGTFKFVGIYPV